jgi:glycosyltransferase involved in cell wall biosynthesis
VTARTVAVILPAFNEAARVERTIDTIARYLATGAPVGPIVLADDGSDDDTAGVARRAAEQAGLDLEILRFPHRGKASVVRSAMLELAPRVTAEYVMMLDADDELQIDQLDRIEWSANPGTIYIGRRVDSDTAARPTVIRRLMSSAMRAASRILLGLRLPDTQCGFKLFPRVIVTDLFGQQRSTGWTFDAELLFIASQVSGLPIQEVPVTWQPRGTSHVRPLSAALSGLAMFGTAWYRIRRVYRPVGEGLASAGTGH